ncbi:hypothetical protein BGZ58_001168 [Dissophora ornata]|nr:hypothetical protein BGZ58_001168 [Dissophora ornata]
MAHQRPRWLALFLLLLLCTILLQSLIDPQHSSSSTLGYVAAAAVAPPSSNVHAPASRVTKDQDASSQNSVRTDSYGRNSGVHRRNYMKPILKRRVSNGDHEHSHDSDYGDNNDNERLDRDQREEKNLLFVNNAVVPEQASWGELSSTSVLEQGPIAQGPSIHLQQRRHQGGGGEYSYGFQYKYAYHDVKVAVTNCNSDTPQTLGPAWDGTFSSNSPEGVYPSETRSCTWTMMAATNSTPGAVSSPTPSPSPSPSPSSSVTGSSKSAVSQQYIIALTFNTSIQLVCGIDYLTLYDGPDATSPMIAKLCGNILMDTPTLYSSGSEMTAVFSTQAQTPGSYGFTALWSSVLPCSICVATGRGICSTDGCICNSGYVGSVCQTETTGFKNFTPRSQHSMAYDSTKDMVYITGGTSSQNTFMWDLLTYTFSTSKWATITLTTKSPDPRYGHFSFVYNSDLYIYGGVSVVGGMVDIWKYNGKQWTLQQPINPDQLPNGRIGPACVLVTSNNSTQLVSFGGMNAAGETMRDLNFYDINTAMWKQADHQNSIGLAGAKAVYHEATESIYFFGGMVNQTTRNVITYQYFIQQDLWYALAPRIDPLTSTPLTNYTGQRPSNPFTNGNDTSDGDTSDGSQNSYVEQYSPPVMYDSVSGVWTPTGLMGDDMVVMYGGIRPFGLGVSARDPSCYVRKLTIYDLSCQNWTTYDIPDATGVTRSRVNHTMVLRPPGATGGNKTAWTGYVFGGFDGLEHQDMFNFTLDVPTPTSADVNNCRALRWCSLYDDCQNCNMNYCSYIGGLCLFDTDKAKSNATTTTTTTAAAASSSSSSSSSVTPAYLLGTTTDIPSNGTLQDLLRQQPDLTAQVVTTSDMCPGRTSLNLGVTYPGILQSGQEIAFKTYIDAQGLDVQFQILTNPAESLYFSSLNVWEGFMNMYWRADHGLTDDTWNGYSGTSSPTPADLSENMTIGDNPVITSAGTLNASELLNRWTEYSGLDASASSSALRESILTYVDFPAEDPRRFSGYYVYSLKNNNPTELSFTLTVVLLDPSVDDSTGQGSSFDLATLGFGMAGFIVGVLLLVLVAYKIRKKMEERDQARQAAALMEEEEEEEEEERRRRAANLASASSDENLKDMKPMYRIVVGVHNQDALGLPAIGIEKSGLRRRNVVRGDQAEATNMPAVPPPAAMGSVSGHARSAVDSMNRSFSDPSVSRMDNDDRRDSRPRSDFICDLGSSPPYSGDSRHQGSVDSSHIGRRLSYRADSTERRHSLKRGWSLKSLSGSTSLKRLLDQSRTKPEDQEGLTASAYDDIMEEQLEADQFAGVGNSVNADRNRQNAKTWNSRYRNPTRVQPISIEPLPFHGGLVPRTKRHYKRYQRSMIRQQQQRQQVGERAAVPVLVRSASQRGTIFNSRATHLRGTLSQAQRIASRMIIKSRVVSSPDVGPAQSESIEMDQFVRPNSRLDDTAVGSAGEAPALSLRDPGSKDSPEDRHQPIGMRGPQEYEPGPLLAVNVLVVFPGDAMTRPVMTTCAEGDEGNFNMYNTNTAPGNNGSNNCNMMDSAVVASDDRRLPPMAIGSVFVPDPARWWAYKAKQQHDRRQWERGVERLRRHQEQFPEKASY